MPSEKQAFEGASVPLRAFVLAGAGTFAAVIVCLAAVFGLYTLWVNGPQAPVKPAPLAASAVAAPGLETGLFRRPPPPATGPDPRIEQAMDVVASRGEKAFDPPGAAAPDAGR